VSQENVDFVLGSYEWVNNEQKVAVDWWHSDGEYVNAREDPDHATYRGLDAIEKLLASWIEAYPDMRVDPIETQANGEHVFVWVRFSGHGASSGMPLDMEMAHVITLEAGRIRRLAEYFDRTEALRAVGLEE
jgi:ketosteroid isomerase-like protein